MSAQYKVYALFWNDNGNCYRLRNQESLEDLLNDGWKISRVDVMPPTKFQSGAVSATNVYILEKQSEDTKKSSGLELLPHDMGLRVELDTNETYYLKSGWKERCDGIYGIACGYGDYDGCTWFRDENQGRIAIMDYHVKLAVPWEEPETKTTKQSEDTNVKGSKPMDNDQGHAVWRESIEKYGKETQSIVCMEECSELIQAISKRLRGKPDATDNLAEEMADVTICLYLLQEMYGITDEQLEEWIARKTARQSKRMQADDPFMEGEDVK